MRVLAVVACFAVLACGRIGFDAGSSTPGDSGGGGESDAAPLGVCPANYTQLNGHCYLLDVTAPLASTWRELELLCEADGPGIHLLVIDNPAELASVEMFMNAAANSDSFMGFSDRGGGLYRTVIGTTPFLVWRVGEPSPQPCGLIDTGPPIGMKTVACSGTADSDHICEHDGVAPDPSSY